MTKKKKKNCAPFSHFLICTCVPFHAFPYTELLVKSCFYTAAIEAVVVNLDEFVGRGEVGRG